MGAVTATSVPPAEIERRYALIRDAMARDGLDAVIVSGNEYTGFEGAVTYTSGFVIVHRYAYVLLPLEGEPAIVFPREATYVGEHGTTWIDEQVFVDCPGEWLADRVRTQRVGVYGLDYVLTVRDYRALEDEHGAALPEFKIAGPRPVQATDMVLPSLEIAGPGGHWVEVSRAICPGEPSADTRRMMEAYEEYYEVAQSAMRDGATAHDVHRAVSRGFLERGFVLGHVTGHSIGMTMIEFPKIGEGDETVLRAGMVLSMHPHAISEDGRACLYMQDTWLVTQDGGVPLAGLPMRIFAGTEARP